jgi:hypothetical protein
MANVRSIKDINFEDIAFSKQKVKSENKFLYVYSERKPLVIKMPKMKLPFGLQKDTMNTNKNQYIMDLSFDGNEELLEKFRELDTVIIRKVQEQFYPDKTVEEVSTNYTSCVKDSNNPQFAPTLRAKIITNDAKQPKCDFYNSEKTEEGKYPKINIEEKGGETFLLMSLNKSSYHETIVECIGLWFFNGRFGMSFKVNQVLMYPRTIQESRPQDECQFIDSDSESSNEDADFLGE